MTENKQVSEMSDEEIKDEVKKAYSQVAQRSSSCCGPTQSSSCGPSESSCTESLAETYGYSVEGLPASVTESFAGCGNPVALAGLKEGEVVLDLGSGAGLDMFVAAEKVGKTGRVIGVDMTQDMIDKAKENAVKLGFDNVEFRLGDIEDLPVEDESVDVIISNCVINLTPNKSKVFESSFRVLKPGGRMMISDIVLETPLPDKMKDDVATYTGCVGGAILEEEYLQLMRDAGFVRVETVSKAGYGAAVSAKIAAYKP
ncbi:MAG: arsenite methyltransferase [Candidatus Thorarchaeota archaeon]